LFRESVALEIIGKLKDVYGEDNVELIVVKENKKNE